MLGEDDFESKSMVHFAALIKTLYNCIEFVVS